MFAGGLNAMLSGMDISVHTQPNAHPVKTEWVDDALACARAAGDPLGALVGRPLAPGDGIMLVGWSEGGPGRYHVIETRPGRGTGPATYMQVVEFSGPRTEEWVAAEQRAATDRLGPATEGIADAVLHGRGCEAPLCIRATLDSAATAPRLQLSGSARLDLRDVGIRVPGFLVRRFVDVSVSTQATQAV
jgi:hypothetical protein